MADPASQKTLDVEVQVGNATVQVQDVLKLPLLEAELLKLTLTQRSNGAGESTTQLHTRLSLWSFSSSLRAWETVIEPWDLIIRVD